MTDIVVPPPIQDLPQAPLITDSQADFNIKAFGLAGALQPFVAQTNATAGSAYTNAMAAQERATATQASAVAANISRAQAEAAAGTAISGPGTASTSSTSILVSYGTKTLATQTGKAWVPGQSVVLARTADPVNVRMFGVVLSYNAASGLLSVEVPAVSSEVIGTGSFADWTISLTAPRTGMATVEAVQQAQPPGARGEFYMLAPPFGWLKANGAAVSRTAYARLFSELGTYYGVGDGSTTFNLPDDRGLFSRGFDDGRGVDTGRTFGSIQSSDNLAHVHTAYDTGHIHGTYDPGHGHVGSTNSSGGHNHGNQQIPQVASDVDRGTAASIFSLDAGQSLPTDGVHSHSVTATPNITNMSIVTGYSAIVVNGSGGTEARPINRAVLVCIKY